MPAEGTATQLHDRLAKGDVAIATTLAEHSGIKIGDTVQIEHAGKTASFRVGGLVYDYHTGGFTVYVDRETTLNSLGIDGVDLFAVATVPQGRDAVLKSLEPICRQSGLAIQSLNDLQHGLDLMLNGVEAAFWVVLVLGLIVAAMGVFSTLATNTMEQAPQLGLLRIIGMTRWQVHRVVFSQATILAISGVLIGISSGVTTAYMMHRCMQTLLARKVQFAWHPSLFLGCSLAALALVWIATYLPAKRAASGPLASVLPND